MTRSESSEDENGSTTGTPPSSSPSSSYSDLKALDAPLLKRKSFQDRKKIPKSIYITAALAASLQLFSGLWATSTLEGWMQSVKESSTTTSQFIIDSLQLVKATAQGEVRDPYQLLKAGLVFALTMSLGYVFLWAPFRAGMWTGTKARKHKVHRYMGLFFMIQYFYAWVEFCTNYREGESKRILPHSIALNGK